MLPGLRLLLVVSLLAILPGCGTLYVAQAARGQWHVMRERQPLPAVIADKRTPEVLRLRLLEVQAARNYASQFLSLPDNHSYRSYADVGRRYVVWNVVATPELSVNPVQWCFPIVGCVAYRGYFSESRAKAFAASLRRKGFDTVIGGVPAYSTLGRLADPVLNTMLGYGDVELAAIIFHELAHQVVYVPGDSAFNEAFATAVERVGIARWLAASGREDQLERYLKGRARQMAFIHLFARRRAELARLYESSLTESQKRERKRQILGALAGEIRALNQRNGEPRAYEVWIAEGLNNAHLASVATYFDCVPAFEALLRAEEGDLPRFYARVRKLARLPTTQRHMKVCGQVIPDGPEPHPAQTAKPTAGERSDSLSAVESPATARPAAPEAPATWPQPPARATPAGSLSDSD